VACHCVAIWKRTENQVSAILVPNLLGGNLSTISWRIWVAKVATDGGASRSKQSILEELTDSLKKTGEGSISTELALGSVYQNDSLSSEAPLFPLPPQTPDQDCAMAF
jgi:hypothetical protein